MNLELYIRMRDLVSGGLAKMATAARRTSNTIKSANGAITQSYDAIKNKAVEVFNTITKSSPVKYLRDARAELQKLLAAAKGGSSSGGGGGGFLRSILPTVGIAGALALGGSMLNDGLQAQARQASFEVLAGKQGGTRLNNNLTKYAQDSIYGNEVYQNAQTMLGFGLNEKDVMPSLKMLGDIAMGSSEKLGSLTLAFSQVKAAGKLTGQDLLQFVNAGFNPLQQMSKDTGISLGVLKEKVSEGAISFEMVEAAFKNATGAGGSFFEMTKKIGETDFGKLQALQGQVEGLSMKIGGMLAPVIGNLISNYLAPFVTWLSSAATWIHENWNWIGMLVTVLGAAVIGYQAIITATNLWAAAQALLNAAMEMNPIGLIIGGIAALVAGIVYAWKNFEGFRAVVLGLWEVFKTVFTNIGGLFKKIFAPIFEAITAFKEGRYIDAAKAVGQMAINLSPVGLAANIVSYAKEGGFTKGVGEAWKRGAELAKDKQTTATAVDAATPTSANLKSSYGALSSAKGKGGEGDETAKGIAGGGPRLININGVKFTDKIEIHNATAKESADELQKILEEMFLRVLNSGAALQ